jgi:hypothetical protein
VAAAPREPDIDPAQGDQAESDEKHSARSEHPEATIACGRFAAPDLLATSSVYSARLTIQGSKRRPKDNVIE